MDDIGVIPSYMSLLFTKIAKHKPDVEFNQKDNPTFFLMWKLLYTIVHRADVSLTIRSK
uniref:Uncharacterized protein n=1 Tax=Lepeophtheirus salmonis TaxID=72036 RepID=A0A0K2U733_LEPSM